MSARSGTRWPNGTRPLNLSHCRPLLRASQWPKRANQRISSKWRAAAESTQSSSPRTTCRRVLYLWVAISQIVWLRWCKNNTRNQYSPRWRAATSPVTWRMTMLLMRTWLLTYLSLRRMKGRCSGAWLITCVFPLRLGLLIATFPIWAWWSYLITKNKSLSATVYSKKAPSPALLCGVAMRRRFKWLWSVKLVRL